MAVANILVDTAEQNSDMWRVPDTPAGADLFQRIVPTYVKVTHLSLFHQYVKRLQPSVCLSESSDARPR